MIPDYAKHRPHKTIAKNRKARHEYEIVQTLEAGISLMGTEVKSLRAGKANLADSYAAFKAKTGNELTLYNLHIAHYQHGSYSNHEPTRDRKLLLNHRESVKLQSAVNEKGYTIVPLELYFSGHIAKVELGLAKPKKLYDKREAVKERETERDIRRKFRV